MQPTVSCACDAWFTRATSSSRVVWHGWSNRFFNIMSFSLFYLKQCIIKQSFESVFVTSGIIKVSVSVISRSLQLRLITLTSTLIIPDITNISSNNCLELAETTYSYHANFKVPISSKFLFPIWFYVSCNELLQIFFSIWIKSDFFYEVLKTWKSYFLAVDPCHWSKHRHAQNCDVDSGMCEFRLDLSHLL